MSCSPDVVVDDEVGVLRLEHGALSLEPVLTVLGSEHDEDLPRRFRSASRLATSSVGASSTVQARSSFGRLAAMRLGRPVVGDRGGEQRRRRRRRAQARRRASPRRSASESSRRRAAPRPARLAASRITSAPRRRASSASATPMRPDERLPTNRTLSSGSRVPPAVTSTRLPASDPGASSCSTRAAISSGSASRPTPHSPSASSPSSGPTSSTPRRTQRLRRSHASRGAPTCAGSSPERRARGRDARAPPR